jgi:hypothetical protein
MNTCGGSDRRMSLTTTLAQPDMLKNRGSGNKRMRYWPSIVLRIHMTNSVDGRAWFKLIESSDVTFFSPSTEEVAERPLRESNQDSNEGDRENDVLNRALGTVEQ